MADENDPYFLYVLDVGEQDFHYLKRDQAILVEFPVFPSKFIELIDLCLQSNATSHSTALNTINSNTSTTISSTSTNNENHNLSSSHFSSTTLTSNFSARLDEITGIFSIVEANMFKHLTHISLQLRPGNDTVIKAYLASRLQYTISIAKQLSKDLDSTQNAYSQEQIEKKRLDIELRDIVTHKESYIQTLNASHNEELATLRIQNMQETEKFRLLHEEELKSMNQQLEELRLQSSNKIHSLEALLTDANQTRSDLQLALKESENNYTTIYHDKENLLINVQQLTEQKIKNEEIRLNLEKDVVRMSSKIDSLQYQLQDKDELISKTMALQRACEDSKVALEEKLNFYIETNDSLQSRIREGSQEITKGNQVIAGQQNDIQQLRDKIRLKGEVIRRQVGFIYYFFVMIGIIFIFIIFVILALHL